MYQHQKQNKDYYICIIFRSKKYINPTSHIIFHNSQRLETKIKHNGEHIVNLICIINFQKLQERFDHINNFTSHVILKEENLNIESIKASKALIAFPSQLSKSMAN
jgi:hypothetical protein